MRAIPGIAFYHPTKCDFAGTPVLRSSPRIPNTLTAVLAATWERTQLAAQSFGPGSPAHL